MRCSTNAVLVVPPQLTATVTEPACCFNSYRVGSELVGLAADWSLAGLSWSPPKNLWTFDAAREASIVRTVRSILYEVAPLQALASVELSSPPSSFLQRILAS